MSENINENINLSLKFYKDNNFKSSLECINKVIAKDQKSIKALGIRASIYEKTNSFEKALNDLITISEIDPSHTFAHYKIGQCYAIFNQYEKAERYFLKSIELDINYAPAYVEIGNLYLKFSLFDKAIQYYKDCEDLDPGKALIPNNIANCYLQMGDLDKAEDYFNKSLEIDQDYYLALSNRGSLFNRKKDYKRAIVDLKKSIELNPDFAESHNNLGLSYVGLGEYLNAEDSYKKAIYLNPNLFEAHNNLGGIYIDLGKRGDAQKSFKKVLDIDKFNTGAFRSLVFNKNIEIKDDISDRFYQLYQKRAEIINENNLNNVNKKIINDQINLAFSFGQLHDAEKKYDEAFSFFQNGNDLYRSTLNYDVELEHNVHNRIIEVFNKESIKDSSSKGYKSDLPIFIVGMPRSGSTLIEQIISSHSKVQGMGEIDLIRRIVFESLDLLKNKDFQNLFLLSDDQLINLGKKYITNIEINNEGIERITDKQLYNFTYIGFIKTILPNAKIIHIKRHPLDTCLSIYTMKFEGIQPYAYNLEELAKFYNLYGMVMDHWEKTFQNSIFTISYEDLINNFEENVSKLLDYCDLDFEDDCINFFNNKRVVDTASSLQVREKLYTSSVNRWRNYQKQLLPLIKTINKDYLKHYD